MSEPWTKKDVARFMKCDVRTVDRLGIPRVEVKGRGKRPLVRYDSDQVIAWWERRKATTQGTTPGTTSGTAQGTAVTPLRATG